MGRQQSLIPLFLVIFVAEGLDELGVVEFRLWTFAAATFKILDRSDRRCPLV
jgi:hypothetical protein